MGRGHKAEKEALRAYLESVGMPPQEVAKFLNTDDDKNDDDAEDDERTLP